MRFVRLGLVLVFIFTLTGCGAVFVGFVWNPGGVPSSVSGTVTIVELGFVSDEQGDIANVTRVTLVDLGAAKAMTFCGDQRTFFPINQSLRAEFTSGTPCSTVMSVVFL